jgi:protein associated with RNAse G/E
MDWPNCFACVDLDLDVVRRPNGRVQLLDDDEFMRHQVELEYPARIIQGARATADWLLDVVTARHEPFGSAGAAWLAAQPWAGGGSPAKSDYDDDDSVG